MNRVVEKVVDKFDDVIDKVSTPSSRAGSTVERVGKMLENGVSLKVIALQMTETSANEKYTLSDVKTLGKLYQDVKTKVPITSKQTKALIADTKEKEIDVSTIDELAPAYIKGVA